MESFSDIDAGWLQRNIEHFLIVNFYSTLAFILHIEKNNDIECNSNGCEALNLKKDWLR